MKRLFWFIACVALFGLIAGYQLKYFGGEGFDTSAIEPPPSDQVKIAGVALDVYVADTPAERQRGLSGRDGLADDEGMLFVFEEDGRHTFWMKDMHFAIDIIWIAADGTVVSVVHNATPDSYPDRTYSPSDPARYVLEVNAGFAARHQIEPGNMLYSD